MLKHKVFFTLIAAHTCLFAFASGEETRVKFTENKGQWDSRVLYRAQLDGGALFLENNCFTYSFYEKEKLRANHIHSTDSKLSKEEMEIKSHAFKMTLKNALMPQSILPQKRSTNYSNFYIGNNPKRWTSHAYDYETVYYKEIYSGIDLEVNGKENSLKYNFIVQPGADVSKICLSYYGIKKITNENGTLKIETPLTTLVESKPYAYQEVNGTRVVVPCHFILRDNEVTFSLPQNYRADLPLIIDPTLIFCSYSGSLSDNFGMTATYDNQGNFYAGGTAFAQGYPTTVGAYDTTYNGIVQAGRTDVVITKYNSTGSNLIYSTYLGGDSSTEIVSSLIVNSNNELMLLGATGSQDFPVTTGAFDTTYNGGVYFNLPYNGTEYATGTDIYLAKFSADGSQLLASTFVGGSANDGVNSSGTLAFNYGDYYRGEIQTDAAGNFYVASCTYSADFPVLNGFQMTPGGGLDGCVFKMSPDLTTMIWCSYLGGGSDDNACSLILDDTLNVFVDGGTASADFPVTSGVISGSYRGGISDAFVTKIKPDGSSILRSTFIGTNLYDQSFFIQRDTLNSIYIFGQSAGNFPVSPGVYSNPNSKQFVARLTHELDTIQLSTVFGNGNGQVNLSPSAFLVDRCGNVYCSGWGGRIIPPTNTMFNMPVTSDAIQSNTDGHNFYFIVFSPFFQSLTYASYFGGGISWEHVDGGTSRFDRNGIIYQSVCAGCGGNSDLPTTPGAWSQTNNSQVPQPNCNNGTIKLDFNITNTRAAFSSAPKYGCPNANVAFTNNSVSAISYEWDFGDGSATNTQFSPTHVFDSSGTFIVRLIAISPFCGIDSTYDTIHIYTPPIADFTHSGVYCTGNTIQFNNGSTSPASYHWNFGDNDSSAATNPSHVYSPSGNYTVTLIVVDTLGCRDTTTKNVSISPLPVATINYTIDTCALTAMLFGGPPNAASYSWDFGDTNTDTLQNTTHTYGTSGTYIVTLVITDTTGCIDTATQTLSPYSFAKADFNYSIDTCSFMVQFTNQSVNSIFNEWHFGDNSPTSSTVHPVHSYPTAGNYTVTLIVNPGTGCVDTAYKSLYLDEHIFADYFIPNIFTPNGDSYNPRFVIKGLDFCDEFLLRIYNRWGELMFQSTSILDSWDGTYKGKDVPDGVYFYIIKGNRVNRAGTVTVKRK